MDVLVIDIGGSKVKFRVWKKTEKRAFVSGKSLTPKELVDRTLAISRNWKYDAVSIGFPGPVIHGKPAGDPPNLGKGWTEFNFKSHFKKPVRIINDAAMQALGSYTGGRMLFVGLGTGLGSALILDDVLVPLELGELQFSADRTLNEVLGMEQLRKLGVMRWRNAVMKVLPQLSAAFRTDYIVLGGGNAELLRRMPAGVRRGSNDNAFLGGALLWNPRRKIESKRHTWVIT